jgi:hypothetical protein
MPLERLDPWGPISTALYEQGNSDLVLNAVGNTGVPVQWRQMTREETYSNSTRIRVLRADVESAYASLSDERRGQFAQIVLGAMLRRTNGAAIREQLEQRLADIGWSISEDGLLRTDDALISERFFPPNSAFDAYIALREVFASARTRLVIVDGYLGPSLLTTLQAVGANALQVRLLTVAGTRTFPDFLTALHAFRGQVHSILVELRTTGAFHDRFVVVDDQAVYHVGASIKDAGWRAFMVSRIEDERVSASIREFIDEAWSAGQSLPAAPSTGSG